MLFLCVDAGGTKTAAAIADQDGQIIAEGFAGPANMAELGVEEAAVQILLATAQAVASCREAEEHLDTPYSFEKAYVGISGCDYPSDVIAMTARLGSHFSTPVHVVNDAVLLGLVAQSQGTSWCCAVVAGTGSIALGLASEQQFAKRGGFGHLFGDVGSAYHLGLTAVRIAAEEFDRDPKASSKLRLYIEEALGVGSICDAPGKIHDVPLDVDPVTASNTRKLRIAELSRGVLPLSASCPVAKRVLSAVTSDLASDIADIAQTAEMQNRSLGGLAITGGLGVQSMYFAELVRQLESRSVHLSWTERVVSPAQRGAQALALAK